MRLYYELELELDHPRAGWYFGSVLVPVLLAFGLFYAITWRSFVRRGTLRLDAERGRFVVDASRRKVPVGIMFLTLASNALPVTRVENADRMSLNGVPGLLPIAAVTFGVWVLLGVTIIVMNRPRVTLDRDGLQLTHLLRTTRVAWADLATGSTRVGPKGRTVDVRDAVSGRIVTLPTASLDVDPRLLEIAIRGYLDEPASQGDIGTEAGLQRLASGRSGAPATAGQ